LGGRMKRYLIALKLAGLALAAWMSPSPSMAQESGVWTHPSGLYWLNYESAGWKPGKPFSYGNQRALVTFEPSKSNDRVGRCRVFENRVDFPDVVDQPSANAVISKYAADKWAARMGYNPEHVRHSSNEMAGSIRVATMVVDASAPTPMRVFYRAFIVFKPDGALHQEFSCSVGPNARPADVDLVLKFLDSLRFKTVASGE